jgi:hypothetical protein
MRSGEWMKAGNRIRWQSSGQWCEGTIVREYGSGIWPAGTRGAIVQLPDGSTRIVPLRAGSFELLMCQGLFGNEWRRVG